MSNLVWLGSRSIARRKEHLGIEPIVARTQGGPHLTRHGASARSGSYASALSSSGRISAAASPGEIAPPPKIGYGIAKAAIGPGQRRIRGASGISPRHLLEQRDGLHGPGSRASRIARAFRYSSRPFEIGVVASLTLGQASGAAC